MEHRHRGVVVARERTSCRALGLIWPATEEQRKENWKEAVEPPARRATAFYGNVWGVFRPRGGPRNFRRSWSRRRGDCAPGSIRRQRRSGFARRGDTLGRTWHERGRKRRSRSHDGGRRRKKWKRLLNLRIAFRWSRRRAAPSRRRRCVDSAMERMDHEDDHRNRTEAERALILCFQIDYTCIYYTFSQLIVFEIVDIRSSCKSGSESARALNCLSGGARIFDGCGIVFLLLSPRSYFEKLLQFGDAR